MQLGSICSFAKGNKALLPPAFAAWFAARGWQAHPHQLELLAADDAALLLIAPTGGGKTLAGFLPTLVDLAAAPHDGLHTLYISPLKALATDIARNLARPVTELALDIRIEDRTGDTRASTRRRQRVDPPHILLTTPESLALLLSYPEAPRIFAGLKRIVVDEIHALAESKRGDQLMLGLSRLATLAPKVQRIGLSATVQDPAALAGFLAGPTPCRVLMAPPGPSPDVRFLATQAPPPWAGGGGRWAATEILQQVKAARTTLIFVNTRALAELFYQAIWAENTENLPIALHHGSLSREARNRVECAMAEGSLRAIVCTGSLDLGIDWGDVDLVIQIGAPKNVKRLVQRIGRASHRYNTPSRALLVPANRFEVLECQAALEAVAAHDLDGTPRGPGPLDVLCQHILLCACAGPVNANALFAEVRTAGPYGRLSRAAFDDCLEFAATGGYALRAYDRWQRLVETGGHWQLRDPRSSRALRMNIGTIVNVETLKVRLRGRGIGGGGGHLGEVEESFAAQLSPGDTFLMGGEVVCFEALRDMAVLVSRRATRKPRIAVFSGSKFSTSTLLNRRVQAIIADRSAWKSLPGHTAHWLHQQSEISQLPRPGRLLAESFARNNQEFLCIYAFAGRAAHQTLGLLVTKQMEAAGLEPLGFVANDYALLIWGLQPVDDVAALLEIDGLRDGLERWLGDNAVMKRSFRNIATIAGLIERNIIGQRKSGKQATFSSDILYDTLHKYDPDHLLLRITRDQAMQGLVAFERIEAVLSEIGGDIDHIRAPHVTPLAAPLLLEYGKVPIRGAGAERLVVDVAARLMAEAGLE
ncbi:MAG: ligase-associated DNA damage response DEXH box helicase [Paracoccaceae bacterium]